MHLLIVCILPFLLVFSSASPVENNDDYNYDYSKEEVIKSRCDSENCRLPDCSCFGNVPLAGDVKRLPQFVMLTFDDAVTTLNVKTYRKISSGRSNSNGCPLAATFFVSHEYNDYEFVNELYRGGHEIAVHSITHESFTDMWKKAPIQRWREEMVGMRHILSRFGGIPPSEIQGHRAPFLQTAGDDTFTMLKDNGFSYDSSMTTRTYMNPPLWPYTLDYGYPQDCQILPCPKGDYPGLWIFPMVQWQRVSKVGSELFTFHCSMVDACTPYPKNASDTIAYMLDNFERHYTSNKAPFPIFLHEAWLRDENRLEGFLEFLDNLLKKDDVFIVTMQEVLEYMKNPVDLEEYKAKKTCFKESRPKAGECDPVVCNYPKRKILMKSCVPCPKRYPWLGMPDGEIIGQ